MTASKPTWNSNGNVWVARTVVLMLWGVGLSAFGSLGLAVDKNDKENVKEHTHIRSEVVQENTKIRNEMILSIGILREEMAQDIKDIQQSQITLLVQQAEILTELKRSRR